MKVEKRGFVCVCVCVCVDKLWGRGGKSVETGWGESSEVERRGVGGRGRVSESICEGFPRFWVT